jgi:hypothetical protein
MAQNPLSARGFLLLGGGVQIQLIGWRFRFSQNRHFSPILPGFFAFLICDAFARFWVGEKPKSIGPVGQIGFSSIFKNGTKKRA